MSRGLALRSLADLPRNARNSILLEPLWAVFGTVVLYYAPLYLRSVGLSSAEIGLLGSVTLALSFVCQAFAAPITNRLGRKRTTLDGVPLALPPSRSLKMRGRDFFRLYRTVHFGQKVIPRILAWAFYWRP